jgi:hypothetical protein
MNEAEDSGESVLFFNIISIPPFLLSPYLLRISVQLLIFLSTREFVDWNSNSHQEVSEPQTK